MQSQYDSWQIPNILGKNSTEDINLFGKLLRDRFFNSVIKNKINGAFLDSCNHHCWSWDDIVISGKDINDVFYRYYMNVGVGQFYDQHKMFPCEICCREEENIPLFIKIKLLK